MAGIEEQGPAGLKKVSYPLKCEEDLMLRGKTLARDHRLSFNSLLTRLLEHAVERFEVPGVEPRPGLKEHREEEKDLT